MNTLKFMVLVIVVSVASPVVAIPLPETYPGARPLRYSLGQWPTMSHNTPYARHVLDRGASTYTFPLKPSALLYDFFGAWGTPNSHHFTYAYATESGLVLGRDVKQTVTIAYAFSAPAGNTFTGGEVTIDIHGAYAPSAQTIECAVTSSLSFATAKGFWARGRAAIEEANAAWHKPVMKDGRYHVPMVLPTGTKEFYVLMRGQLHNRDTIPAALTALSVKPTFTNPHAIAMSWGRAEPVFVKGESIVPDLHLSTSGVTASGTPSATWELTRHASGIVERGEHSAHSPSLNLTGLETGLYDLKITWQGMPQVFEFVVFPKHNDTRLKRTLFGAFGQPNRRGVHGGLGLTGPDAVDRALMKHLGMRWTVSSVLWAWRQKTRQAPLDTGYLSQFKTLAEDGFEVICTMGTTPAWASGGKRASRPPLPDAMPAWEKHCQEVATSLKLYVTWFQTWNEPNNPHALWQAKWNTDKRIAIAKSIQHHQFRGILAGNPKAKLMGGNFAGLPADWVAKWLSGSDSTLHSQHGMSGHPYCKVTKEENYAHKHPAEPDFVPRVMAMRKAMDDAGASAQPLFFTEYGWFSPLTSPDDMARWTARQNCMTAAYRDKAKIESAAIFSPGDIKNGHNLLKFNRDLRGYAHRFTPVSLAFAVSTAQLANMTPLAPISDHPSTLRAYGFEDESRTLFTAWQTERHVGQAEVSIASSESARVGLVHSVSGVSSFGVFSRDAALSLPENHDPVYVSFYKRPAASLMAKKINHRVGDAVMLSLANVGSGTASGQVKVIGAPWLALDNAIQTLAQGHIQTLTLPIAWDKVPVGNHTVTVSWVATEEGHHSLPSQQLTLHLSKP